MMKLAQGQPIELFDDPAGYTGFGPLGLEQGQQATSVFVQFINSALGLISLIAIIWFMFIVITGALGIMTSGGDKAANENAKKKISSGLIGLIITIIGMLVIRLIGTIMGIPDILEFGVLFERLLIQ